MTGTRAPLPLPEARPIPPPADLEARLDALGVQLSPEAVARVGAFLGLLVAMNERVNLTRITEPEAAWSRHALDALGLVPLLADLAPGARVADVGAGGGVPGIPLAIARPDLAFSLIEATGKKAEFLRAAAAALGLSNVEVVAERAESVASSARARSFDAVTARAVAALDVLVGWTAPLSRPGGRLLLVKGERADEELRAAKRALRVHRASHEATVLRPTGRIVVLRVDA